MQTSVTNPNPKLKTVAIVPFFNLSQEPDVDGRRFALAYFSELQKVPGFQVLPLGVAEVAMVEHQLQMNNPEDVLKLAQVLNVDAVVIGAVTDYSPYYPPRIGMQVSWYSPHAQEFIPGFPLLVEERHAKKTTLNELFYLDRLMAKETKKAEHEMKRAERQASHMERKAIKQDKKIQRKMQGTPCPDGCPPEKNLAPPALETVFRGQSSEYNGPLAYNNSNTRVIQAYAQANQGAQTAKKVIQVPMSLTPQALPKSKQRPVIAPKPPIPPSVEMHEKDTSDPNQLEEYCPPEEAGFDPRQPFMSYTRLFDGSDAALVAHLRDYLEVSGDRRSGGWEAYLHRSEDFIRFTSHLMILEMLTLHGGQAKHQIIFKVRKYR